MLKEGRRRKRKIDKSTFNLNFNFTFNFKLNPFSRKTMKKLIEEVTTFEGKEREGKGYLLLALNFSSTRKGGEWNGEWGVLSFLTYWIGREGCVWSGGDDIYLGSVFLEILIMNVSVPDHFRLLKQTITPLTIHITHNPNGIGTHFLNAY